MSNTLVDQIVINLAVLSNIQESGRLSTSRGWSISIEKEGYFQSIWRTVTGDSRRSTVHRIRQVVQSAIEYCNDKIDYIQGVSDKKQEEINHYERDRFDTYCLHIKTIREKMVKAVEGVSRLKMTYKDDATTLAELDVIIDQMNNHIKRMENYSSEFSKMSL